jgi:acyl carrier protein
VRERVFDIIAQVMNVTVGSLSEESSPESIEAWDSLKHMSLILTLEEEFGIQFSDEEIVTMLNVGLIMDALKHKLEIHC